MGDATAGILDLPARSLPEPGQYLPTMHLEDELEILTHPLFRVIGPAGRHTLGPIPSHWQPSDQIACLPPQGNGFKLAPSAKRIGLLALDGQPHQILPLVADALQNNAAVALFFQERPMPALLDWIPSSVEISPLSALKENLDWPDYLAVEIARENLSALTTHLGEENLQITGQVLVKTPMPCRGIGACGVCSVKTVHGWRQACSDGPVFPLKELLHVAG